MRAVFVAIAEEDCIGELDALELVVSRGEADDETLAELLPDLMLEPEKDADDDGDVESEFESLLKADELDERDSELLPDEDI
jgi:hypothetical protein